MGFFLLIFLKKKASPRLCFWGHIFLEKKASPRGCFWKTSVQEWDFEEKILMNTKRSPLEGVFGFRVFLKKKGFP